MLIALSPAKSLDFERPVSTSKFTMPEFLDDSQELVDQLKDFTPDQLATLMKISDKLSSLNVARFGSWTLPFTPENAKQAILCFTGDVYRGLDATTLDHKGLDYAQNKVRILSGLYGILKPLDLMQPYRLEMSSRLKNTKGKDLYTFWGDKLNAKVSAELAKNEFPTLINLASKEYFTSLKLPTLQFPVITPVFKDWKNGQYKHINFYAKKARGLMTRYAIDNKIEDPQVLKNFDYEGYQFDESLSSENGWIFTRKQ
ncbi:MAG: peroxide stress protein YaaA [Gammaproteobacteria bacterium]|nr:peroxide stress protein YaaA [Gammaproteobacteria bacterium]